MLVAAVASKNHHASLRNDLVPVEPPLRPRNPQVEKIASKLHGMEVASSGHLRYGLLNSERHAILQIHSRAVAAVVYFMAP